MEIWKFSIWFSFMWHYDNAYTSENINYFSTEQQCEDFINPKLEKSLITRKEYSIKSPNYPNKYPYNIDCIFIIQAPREDMIIKVHFIKHFTIEPSKNCTNDFLQLNDGPYGFSRIIRKFCGPYKGDHTLESTDRYMWLRFYSDSTISETGFKLIYWFIIKEKSNEGKNNCYKKVTVPSGHSALLSDEFLSKHFKTLKFRTQIQECIFDIRVNEESNIFISLSNSNFSQVQGESQFIEIYDKVTIKSRNRINKFYFYLNKYNTFKQRLLTSQRAVFRIVFKEFPEIIKFQFIVTSLARTFEGERCLDTQFKCKDTFCISKQLTCNSFINCPFREDETCLHGRIATEEQILAVSTTVDPNKLKKILNQNLEKFEEYKLHGKILGGIGLVLMVLLLVCIILSIKQSKNKQYKNSKLIKRQNVFPVNNVEEEDIVFRCRQLSTTTLTTGQSTKKQYNNINISSPYFKAKVYKDYPFSNWDNNDNSVESLTPPIIKILNNGKFDDYKISKKLNTKSTSNLTKVQFQNNFRDLNNYKSLPNDIDKKIYLTESIPKLFYNDSNPIPVLMNETNIPKIKKYYA